MVGWIREAKAGPVRWNPPRTVWTFSIPVIFCAYFTVLTIPAWAQAPVRGCFWLYEDIEVVIHEDRDFHPVRGPEGYIGHGHHVLVVFNR